MKSIEFSLEPSNVRVILYGTMILFDVRHTRLRGANLFGIFYDDDDDDDPEFRRPSALVKHNSIFTPPPPPPPPPVIFLSAHRDTDEKIFTIQRSHNVSSNSAIVFPRAECLFWFGFRRRFRIRRRFRNTFELRRTHKAEQISIVRRSMSTQKSHFSEHFRAHRT